MINLGGMIAEQASTPTLRVEDAPPKRADGDVRVKRKSRRDSRRL
jgi:hypothetical protein